MIFYFSATGNSEYVANQIAKNTDDNTISIADEIKNNNYEYEIKDNEKIGFVMPIYILNIPKIVEDFIKKIKFKNYSSQYSYAIFTCGGMVGYADKTITELMYNKEIYINSIFSVIMPDNYIIGYDIADDNKIQKILNNAETKLSEIITHIKTKNDYIKQPPSMLPEPISIFAYKVFYKFAMGTKKFHVTDTCIGCGLCEEICPNSCIKLVDKKPVWIENTCSKCLACIHRCKMRAIQYGEKTYSRKRYINPNVQ